MSLLSYFAETYSVYYGQRDTMRKILGKVGFSRENDPALVIALQFVMAGIVWILFSDSFMYFISPDNVIWKLAHVHVLKGLVFVGVTSGFIFYWINHYVQLAASKQVEITALFESSPMPMVVADAATLRLLEGNNAFLGLFNYSSHDLRGTPLASMTAEPDQFESLSLLIRTGSTDPGVWRMKNCNGNRLSVRICVQPVRSRHAYLLMLMDVTSEVEIRSELKKIRDSFEVRLNNKVDELARDNEELAYRASQSEHVNNELIAVNERLQSVNKKIAAQLESAVWMNKAWNNIVDSFSEAVWLFDLCENGRKYTSKAVSPLFNLDIEASCPWFWLDYINAGNEGDSQITRELFYQKGEFSGVIHVVSDDGRARRIVVRVKLIQDEKRNTEMLVGTAAEIPIIREDAKVPQYVSPKSPHTFLG